MSDDRSDDFDDFEGDDEFDDVDEPPLDEHETQLVQQDLSDLADFEATFEPEGYRGVAMWCHDCGEDHFYPWDMLRENLEMLIQTGETPVHEPAFAPEPSRYIPWDYARGYVDALREVGADQRLPVDACPRCGLALEGDAGLANYCPRCGVPLLVSRLRAALAAHDLDEGLVESVLRKAGVPGRPDDAPDGEDDDVTGGG